jgi:zinc transport system substrate-binding protein
MARLIDQAGQKGIRVILISPQHSAHEAEAIASDLQGKVIKIDPLSRDYSANLRQVTQELAAILSRD